MSARIASKYPQPKKRSSVVYSGPRYRIALSPHQQNFITMNHTTLDIDDGKFTGNNTLPKATITSFKPRPAVRMNLPITSGVSKYLEIHNQSHNLTETRSDIRTTSTPSGTKPSEQLGKKLKKSLGTTNIELPSITDQHLESNNERMQSPAIIVNEPEAVTIDKDQVTRRRSCRTKRRTKGGIEFWCRCRFQKCHQRKMVGNEQEEIDWYLFGFQLIYRNIRMKNQLLRLP